MLFRKVALACLLVGTSTMIPVQGWSTPNGPHGRPSASPKASQQKAVIADAVTTPDSAAQPVGVSRKGFLVGAAAFAAVAPFVDVAQAAEAAASSSKYYTPAPESLRGKTIVITGGTAGLGLESAKRLAAAGATVVITSRTPAKGDVAVAAVNQYLTQSGMASDARPPIYSVTLDLDDLANVKEFPQRFTSATNLKQIDVLMNNAGVMAIPDRQLTKDGYERTFQSNHLGHFVLTAELFDLLSRDDATVINVSSEAYQIAKPGLELDNLNGETKYGPWSSYGQSKLSNILFTQELQRRADASGNTWLKTVVLHPGAVGTDLGRNLVGEEKWNELKNGGEVPPLQMAFLNILNRFVKTVEDGASTQVFLAAEPGSATKAAFYTDLKPQKIQKFAKDETAAKQLWAKSEELSGVSFELK